MLTAVTVREAATELATRSGEPLVIAPEAERFAGCVRLTLLVPTPRPVPEVAALLDAPLRAEGFVLSRAPAGWTLTHEGEAPSACAQPAVGGAPLLQPHLESGPPPPPTGPVAETHVDIPREEVEGWLANQDEMMSSARVIPHEEAGRVVGLRLFGIRPNSVPARLGFMNGDTVYTVNDHSLASPDQMLEAYAALREASEYRVDLSRRGARVLHVIRVIGR